MFSMQIQVTKYVVLSYYTTVNTSIWNGSIGFAHFLDKINVDPKCVRTEFPMFLRTIQPKKNWDRTLLDRCSIMYTSQVLKDKGELKVRLTLLNRIY